MTEDDPRWYLIPPEGAPGWPPIWETEVTGDAGLGQEYALLGARDAYNYGRFDRHGVRSAWSRATVPGVVSMLLVAVAGVILGLVAAVTRGRGRGDWTPGPPSAPRVMRSVGQFIRGSGGDGWGGPSNGTVWDQPRKGGW